MAITYGSAASASYGTGSGSANIPTCVAGDFLLLVIVGKDSLPALPDGWTNIGTNNNSTNVYVRACYKIASSSESAVTIADSGAYTHARVFVFKGNTIVNPINASTTSTDDGAAFVAAGVTTTVDRCMIVHATGFVDDGTADDTSNYSGAANANLTGVLERNDIFYYSGASAKAGLYLLTGTKATAGATGDSTATVDSANNYSATVTFALAPAPIELVTVGNAVGGANSINVTVPTGYAAGDLLVLLVCGKDSSPALPDGWTNIGTANNSTNIYNRTCYKIAGASESTLTVADTGAYTVGRMLLFKGNDTTNPIHTSTTSTDSGTTFVASGVTTTVDECMIVHATTFTDDTGAYDVDSYESEANASLNSLTEKFDVFFYTSASANGGEYGLIGPKTIAGATGNTTATADSANNYSATVTFAIQPPQEVVEPLEGGSSATVTISADGSGLSIRLGGSSATVSISGQGSGLSIRKGSSSASLTVSSDGNGLKISSGGDSSPITIDSDGSGIKVGLGSSDSTVIISAEGSGEVVAAIITGGSSSTVTISNDGTGTKIGFGSAESIVTVAVDGSGIKSGTSGSDSSAIISSDGSGTKTGIGASQSPIDVYCEALGTKTGIGSSDSPITISAQGNGKKIAFGSSDATVTISNDGAGYRVMSGGSEVSIVVSNEGNGSKISFSGSESEIIVSADGSGFGSLKTGGNSSTVIITPQGNGSKITWGSGEQVVIIDVDGRGRKYNPIIITAIFSHEVEVDALFDYGAEVMAIFDYEAGQTATFNYESEQTANFVPALTIGGIYGDS